MRDRTERPQDEHEAMPPAPVYPKCAYGHSATGPRVINPAFDFASGRVYSAPRTSPARAFFRVSIDVHVPRTFARQFPRSVAASLHVSAARVPARGVRADYSSTAKSGIPARLCTYTAAVSHVFAKMAISAQRIEKVKLGGTPKPAKFIQFQQTRRFLPIPSKLPDWG